jgi:ubiquinone biosynthesis protein
VTIKIQRPGLAQRLPRDFRWLRVVARVLELLRVPAPAPPRRVVRELSEWLTQEIDFNREAVNQLRLRRLAASSRTVRIPMAYRRLSSARVLVSERLTGIPLTEILAAAEIASARQRRWLDSLDLDLPLVAETLLDSTLEQIFDFRFFHADVHPGNLLVLPGNVIGYVDFGLCGTLEERIVQNQRRYLTAVFQRDIPTMFVALLELLAPSPHADVSGLRQDFTRATRALLEAIDVAAPDRPPASRRPAVADWLVTIMRAVRSRHFDVPVNLLAMYRTLLTAETVAHRLAPDVSLHTVGLRFFTRRSWPCGGNPLVRLIDDWVRTTASLVPCPLGLR